MLIGSGYTPNYTIQNQFSLKKRRVATVSKTDLNELSNSMQIEEFKQAYRLTLSEKSLELYENEFGYVPDNFLRNYV